MPTPPDAPFRRQPFTGKLPLCDGASGPDEDPEGGLYPGGQNQPDPAHMAAGAAAAAGILPRDRDGQPDPGGQILLLAVGMSNTGLYFEALREAVSGLTDLHPRLRLVNATLEGKDIRSTARAEDPYWRLVDHRIRSAEASVSQVQAVWFMQACHAPGILPGEGSAHIARMTEYYTAAMGILRARFPNLRQVFSSGREYGGYNPPGQGNPEPYAFYTGLAWKRLIAAQINGDPRLSDIRSGAPRPWLGWAGYFWADGERPRQDGLCWLFPEDFQEDGVHPSPAGCRKAGAILSDFFTQSPLTPWFRKPGALASAARSM